MTEQLSDIKNSISIWRKRHKIAGGITIALIVFLFLGICPIMLFLRDYWVVYLVVVLLILLASITIVGFCIHKIDTYEDLLDEELLNMNRCRYFKIDIVNEEEF